MRPLSLRISPPTRSLSVVAALAIFCLLAAPAHAVSYFDWYYSTGTGGCWQTGTISSPSYQCNNVGAGYVASNMIGNGGQYDSTLTTSGDYCNEYGMELFNEPISDDLSQWTGFTTPTPHSSYTVGSGYGGICEASGDTWGQMAVSDSQNECSGAVCGVHHFASLGGLSGSDRPFAAAFGDPTLRVQGHFDAGRVQRIRGRVGIPLPDLERHEYTHWSYYFCRQHDRTLC